MADLEPRIMSAYAADEHLDVIEIALDSTDEWVRTSQVIVLPHVAAALTVTGVEHIVAASPW